LRNDRKEAAKRLVDRVQRRSGSSMRCCAVVGAVGLPLEDDFDAMAGLLSMLQIVTGQRLAPHQTRSRSNRSKAGLLGQEFSEA